MRLFKKKMYYEVNTEDKNDLIGTYYKCNWCNKKIKITEEGINHGKYTHYIKYSLDDLLEINKTNRNFKEIERNFWFKLA